MQVHEFLSGFLVSIVCLPACGLTGELPRHASIGLAVAPADATKPEDRETNPPIVKTVLPGSPGEEAGFQAGDVLQKLNGVPVTPSRQRAMTGTPLDVVEAEVRAGERCAHRFFVDHERLEEVVKSGPACADTIASFAGV